MSDFCPHCGHPPPELDFDLSPLPGERGRTRQEKPTLIDLTFAACPVKLTVEKDTASQDWLICARLTLGGPKKSLQQYRTKVKGRSTEPPRFASASLRYT